MAKTAQSFHYYASTCYGWACADSRKEALKKAINYCGSSILKRAKASTGGVSATVCRVELPQAAHYTISGYLPHTITKEDGVNESRKGERVPLSEIENVRITTMQGATIPNHSED